MKMHYTYWNKHRAEFPDQMWSCCHNSHCVEYQSNNLWSQLQCLAVIITFASNSYT